MKTKEYKRAALIGFILMIVGYISTLTSAVYLGTHVIPTSELEFLCDVLAASIAASGCTLMIFGIISQTILEIKEIKSKKIPYEKNTYNNGLISKVEYFTSFDNGEYINKVGEKNIQYTTDTNGIVLEKKSQMIKYKNI